MNAHGFDKDIVHIIPFLSKILSVKYPKSPAIMCALYLLVTRKLKSVKFKVKVITEERFRECFNNNYNKELSVDDENASCLMSVNSMVALHAKNKCWLRISKENENDVVEIDNENENVHIVMPQVPGSKTQSNVKMGCNLKHSRPLQCIAVASLLEDFCLYVNKDTYFNLKQRLGLPLVPNTGSVEVSAMEYNPCMAEKATVSPVISSHDMLLEDSEEILHAYFETPKYMMEGDVFSVVLKDVVPHFICSGPYHNVEEVWFKVGQLMADKETAVSGCYVVKTYTRLFLTSNVPSLVPAQTCKAVAGPRGACLDLPLCPGGLAKHASLLRDLMGPFLRGSQPKARPVFLLTGPRGCGKTTIAYSVAKSLGLHVFRLDCFELYGSASFGGEAKMEAIFAKVKKLGPCVVLLSNVELLGKDREDREDTRLVFCFLERLAELLRTASHPVVVLGVTQSAAEILPAVARSFVCTVAVGPPQTPEACAMLEWTVQAAGMSLDPGVSLMDVAARASGYVYGDLGLLVRIAVRFWREEEEGGGPLLQAHFDKALGVMEAMYSDAIGAPRIPAVRWDDVGGLAALKEEVGLTLSLPLRHPELAVAGLKRSGLLLYGPPGTGKTLLAKAVATESKLNFLSVKGPELLNMYVGQSERNVREVWDRARNASPCVIFLDELDSLAPNRGRSGDSGGVADRVVSQLLAEMDGLHRRGEVLVMAATNRPDLVDPALLRPGRLDKMLYVGACQDHASKLSVLAALSRKFSLADDVNLSALAELLPPQVTGADLYSVCSNAWMNAAREAIAAKEKEVQPVIPLRVTSSHFTAAISGLVPTLNQEDMLYYEQLKSLER